MSSCPLTCGTGTFFVCFSSDWDVLVGVPECPLFPHRPPFSTPPCLQWVCADLINNWDTFSTALCWSCNLSISSVSPLGFSTRISGDDYTALISLVPQRPWVNLLGNSGIPNHAKIQIDWNAFQNVIIWLNSIEFNFICIALNYPNPKPNTITVSKGLTGQIFRIYRTDTRQNKMYIH